MGYQGNIAASVPLEATQITEFGGEWHDPFGPSSDTGPDTGRSMYDVLWAEHGGQLTAGQAAWVVVAVVLFGWAATLLG